MHVEIEATSWMVVKIPCSLASKVVSIVTPEMAAIGCKALQVSVSLELVDVKLEDKV